MGRSVGRSVGRFACRLLQNALSVLSTFDLVMTLEQMSAQSPILLRRGFGWEKNRILSLNNRRSAQKPLPVTEADKQLLRDHNQVGSKEVGEWEGR